MKKIILLIIYFILIISLYTVLVPVKIYKNKIVKYKNHFSFDKKSTNKNIEGYFFRDNECGYYSDNGIIHYKKTEENNYIQANKFGYIIYEKVGDKIFLYNLYGEKIKEIFTGAYPYCSSDYPIFYTIKTNGTGFSLYSMYGDNLIENIDYSSLITCLNSDKYSNTLVSLLDGRTYYYSVKGEILLNIDNSNNNSKIKFTKSNSIDEDSDYIAICSGIDPEIIDIYNKKNGTRLYTLNTDTNFNYTSFLKFNNNFLYYEGMNKLNILNLKSKKIKNVNYAGELVKVSFDNNNNIFIISEKDNIFYFYIYYPNYYLFFYKEFNVSIENLNIVNNNSFYIRILDNIVKFEMDITS